MKRKMFVKVLLVTALFCFTTLGAAEKFSGFSAGFCLGQNYDSMAVGLETKSPVLFSLFGAVDLRLHIEGDLRLTPYYEEGSDGEKKFESYALRSGLMALSPYHNKVLRTYGNLGMVTLFPNGDLDDESVRYGIYGDFGFEVPVEYEKSPVCLFAELGSESFFPAPESKSGAIYIEGVRTSAGFRYYF